MKKEFLLSSLRFENKFFSNIIIFTFIMVVISTLFKSDILIFITICMFFVEGILLFIGFILSYKKMKTFLKNAIKTDGEIIEIINDKKTSFKSAYRPLVRFKTKDDKEITFINEVSDKTITGVPFNQGEKVSILYNPKNPNEAYINTKTSIWLKTNVILYLSISFIIIPIYILYHLKLKLDI